MALDLCPNSGRCGKGARHHRGGSTWVNCERVAQIRSINSRTAAPGPSIAPVEAAIERRSEPTTADRIAKVGTGAFESYYSESLSEIYPEIEEDLVDGLARAGFEMDDPTTTDPAHRQVWAEALLTKSTEFVDNYFDPKFLSEPWVAEEVINDVCARLDGSKPDSPLDHDSPVGATSALF